MRERGECRFHATSTFGTETRSHYICAIQARYLPARPRLVVVVPKLISMEGVSAMVTMGSGPAAS